MHPQYLYLFRFWFLELHSYWSESFSRFLKDSISAKSITIKHNCSSAFLPTAESSLRVSLQAVISSLRLILSKDNLLISPLSTWICIGHVLPSDAESQPFWVRPRSSGCECVTLNFSCWGWPASPSAWGTPVPTPCFWISTQLLDLVGMQVGSALLWSTLQEVVVPLDFPQLIYHQLQLVLKVVDLMLELLSFCPLGLDALNLGGGVVVGLDQPLPFQFELVYLLVRQTQLVLVVFEFA